MSKNNLELKPHIDDETHRITDFIQELAKVQDQYYRNLRETFGIVEGSRLDEWLFDYVYNYSERAQTFTEWLYDHTGKEFEEMLKTDNTDVRI
jgi:hypothetical protein